MYFSKLGRLTSLYRSQKVKKEARKKNFILSEKIISILALPMSCWYEIKGLDSYLI